MKRMAGLVQPRESEIFAHTSLRGLAALSVVGYHACLSSDITAAAGGPVAAFFLSSFIFVDLFFMLSGFIMVETYGARLYATPGLTGVYRFWARRATKILPNYYFWLAIAFAVYAVRALYFDPTRFSNPCLPEAAFRHLLLVQNLLGACVNFNTPLWSVVVEIVAYMAFPLLLLALPAWPVLCVAAVAGYGLLLGQFGTIDVINGGPSILRCLAGFIAGMALARACRLLPPTVFAWAQLPIFLAMVISVACDNEPLALVFIFFTVLLSARNFGPLVAVMRGWLLYLLGRASFSIYLAHIPVLAVVNVFSHKIELMTGLPLASDWRIFLCLNLGLSSLVGTYSYFLIEQRFERILRPHPRPLPP
jgi:peptidoglycan/LPS O-acetylase OafA/YrhL